MIESAELALVADELPVAIWMGRVPSGEVVYTNKAFREVLGIDPPEGAARGAFVDPYGVHTLTGEPYPEDRMPFEQVIAARAMVVLDDLVIHRRDGRRVNLRVIAKPIFDAENNLTHVLEAFTDITREVEAERARIEGDRRLARSQRLESIGQLVAGIAHDFNNLLTVTKLSVSWLCSNDKDPARLEALRQVNGVTDSAIDLIKNLLGFARREKQMSAPISLERVALPVIEMARRTFDRAINLRAELADGAKVLGDESQIEQMLMNLLLNARDAITGSGEVVVRVRSAAVDEAERHRWPPKRHVVLEVVDTGCGIDRAIKDRIFEPYFTTKTQGSVKGTGLGLATVHGIVKAHGGFVEVEDNPGGGTVMRVVLPEQPKMPSRAPARFTEAARSSTEPGASAHTEGALVLVVDDEPLVRASTATTLQALGFRVCEAGDGKTALELFAKHQSEVAGVILDMIMPGLRGRDVYLGIRQLDPDVPVLIVTGIAESDELESLVSLGVSGVLPKPYDEKQLATMLERVGVLRSPRHEGASSTAP